MHGGVRFGSHTYTDWEQIAIHLSPRGEDELHGLKLDWKRFVSRTVTGLCREEIRAVKTYSDLPVTTNMMMYFHHWIMINGQRSWM